jgi:hypothetical protein
MRTPLWNGGFQRLLTRTANRIDLDQSFFLDRQFAIPIRAIFPCPVADQ